MTIGPVDERGQPYASADCASQEPFDPQARDNLSPPYIINALRPQF
jgi:hypothetical protein